MACQEKKKSRRRSCFIDDIAENVASVYGPDGILKWFDEKAELGHSLNAMRAYESYERIILQIGPDHGDWRPKFEHGYRYVVVGAFTPVAALNVKRDAEGCAKHLMKNATENGFRFVRVAIPMRRWAPVLGSSTEYRTLWRSQRGAEQLGF